MKIADIHRRPNDEQVDSGLEVRTCLKPFLCRVFPARTDFDAMAGGRIAGPIIHCDVRSRFVIDRAYSRSDSLQPRENPTRLEPRTLVSMDSVSQGGRYSGTAQAVRHMPMSEAGSLLIRQSGRSMKTVERGPFAGRSTSECVP